MNVVFAGTGAAVLIRAVQPIAGLEFMQEMRQAALKQAPGKRRRKFKAHELCDGPSKMCRAFALTKDECNAVDLSVSDMIWVEPGYVVPRERIVACKRIGVDYYGEEWASKPLRFYAFDSQCVSVRDKPAEALLATTAE
jgi:DNA-3-methyladenine glycosylase